MTKYAMIKFKGTENTYNYICNIDGLVDGDKVIVVGRDGLEKKATFKRYIPEIYVSPGIEAYVLRKRITKVTVIRRRTVGEVNRRSEKGCLSEANFLASILAICEKGLTAKQIGEIMNIHGYKWKEKSYTSLIQTSMKYNPTIKQVDRGLYIHKKFLGVAKIG
jgi:hypothetical protein